MGMRYLPLCLVLWGPVVAAAPEDVPAVLPEQVTPAGATGEEAMTLRRSIGLTIAQAYGLESWGQVEQIDFTFNVQSGDKATSRRWTWRPKDRRVTLHTEGGEPVTYRQDDPDKSDEAIRADRHFVNDSYWFLFPFQIVWSNPGITERGAAPLPIGEGEAAKVTVQYPDEGGYTPGDAYDLYLDEDHHIVQWVFRRGGGERGSPATWERRVSLGPIVVTLEHWGPGREFHLWFSDVSLRIADDDGQVATHEPAPPKDH